jgi:hypothetical protein
MWRIVVIAVVAVCMLLGAEPADAARKSVSGVDLLTSAGHATSRAGGETPSSRVT